MGDHLQLVSGQVDRAGDLYVQVVQELVGVSRGRPDATQEWVAAKLQALGCDVELLRYSPGDLSPKYEFSHASTIDPGERLCVIGTLPGDDRGHSLLLFAHPDVEPATDVQGWRHPAFAGTLEGGRLYGWGVADDLAGIAIMVCALMALSAAGRRPRNKLILASAPSKGNARGILAVLDRGYAAGGAIYLHPAESGRGLRDIKAITPGLLRFQLSVFGKSPDTQEPEQTPFHHLAINPIEKAWILVRALQGLDKDRAARVRHPILEEAIGRATNIQLGHLHAGDPDHLNRIGGTCILGGSVTFPPHERMQDVLSEIARSLESAANEDPWLRQHPPRLEWLQGVCGAESPLRHALYAAAARAIRVVTGEEPKVNPLHASSDIRHPMVHSGIPTIGYGPLAGNFIQAGGTDEWVDVANYLQAIKVTSRLILDWCGVHEVERPLAW
jgi:acetylornithine deacetylase